MWKALIKLVQKELREKGKVQVVKFLRFKVVPKKARKIRVIVGLKRGSFDVALLRASPAGKTVKAYLTRPYLACCVKEQEIR